MNNDPRGIRRKVLEVNESPTGGPTEIKFECGHVSQMANHFHYTIGSMMFCFQCGKEAGQKQ